MIGLGTTFRRIVDYSTVIDIASSSVKVCRIEANKSARNIREMLVGASISEKLENQNQGNLNNSDLNTDEVARNNAEMSSECVSISGEMNNQADIITTY